MSRFSDYLTKLIKQRKEPISSIARNSGVERTSIHKAMTGERVLSYKNARLLSDYLMLSPHEALLYQEYYSMQLQGEAVFQTRGKIVNLLSTLHSIGLNSSQIRKQAPEPASPPSEDNPARSLFQTGEYLIRHTIHEMLEKELTMPHPSVQLLMPLSSSYLFNSLISIFSEYETDITVTHAIPLVRDPADGRWDPYIDFINYPVVLSIISRAKYTPYYYYIQQDALMAPFPYFMLTSTELLCFDESLQNAVVVFEPEPRSFFFIYLVRILRYCRPLFQLMDDIPAKLQEISERNTIHAIYEITAQPTLLQYLSPRQIGSMLLSPEPEKSVHLRKISSCIGFYSKRSECRISYFTRNGIRRFMETGYFQAITSKAIEPLTPEGRKAVLAAFCEDLRQERAHGFLVNDTRLLIPEELTFILSHSDLIIYKNYPTNGLLLYTINLPSQKMLKEFVDFGEFLQRSQYVYTREETIEFLESFL